MTNSTYQNHKEKVLKAMNNLVATYETYKTFLDLMFIPIENNEVKVTINKKEKHILRILQRALLTDVYISVRKLLSVDDYALPLLYIKHYDHAAFKKIGSSQDKNEKAKLKKELVHKILPNSYEQYKKMKRYIEKTIAHIDKNGASLEGFALSDLEFIYSDIDEAFNLITLKKEVASYSNSVLLDEAKSLSNSFFKKIVDGLHPKDRI